ncbi:CvpA family protein [Tautonia sp. JC769]|uniref:CvpA family protein n=1 Tax=Tautonia sp. JC769 TaxID=3232135 RepID=UPI00345A9D45
MGMDVILGAMVVIAALRGWFRGFFAQAIRIGGLVGAVYLAAPVRDLARPIVAARLTSMGPELLDRLLWWVAFALVFVVLSGLATTVLSASRRRIASASGMAGPSHRGDQSAGALLGAAKGAIVVAFLVSAIQPYTPDYVASGGWVGEQVETSYVLAFSARYEPARRLWEAEPVQALVAHVREMGLGSAAAADAEGDPEPADETEEQTRRAFAVDASEPQTQARAPSRRAAPLAVESKPSAEPQSLQEALEDVRRDLDKLDALRNLVPR